MAEIDALSGKAEKAKQIFDLLDLYSPLEPGFLKASELGAYQLLIAVILSAQTTDIQVNRVTDRLFASYPAPEDLAKADMHDVEQIIHSTGYYRAKARHIIGTAKAISTEFGSIVPQEMEKLTRLPGVGRKTASV
nr:endonuclease III [Spirochaetales bacterium]